MPVPCITGHHQKEDGHTATHDPKSKPAEAFRHVRRNPSTGEEDTFFPLEITDPSIRALAKEQGLDLARTRLGSRTIEAVMVPCKETATQHNQQIFLDTPPEVQHRRYLAYISDELVHQDARRQETRCYIPDGNGGLKRCRPRKPNPAYRPGSKQPKTLPVRCEGCPYRAYRPNSSTERFCEEAFLSPRNPFEADRYEAMRKAYLAIVKQHTPNLCRLAALLTLEYSIAEAARELHLPFSTVASQAKKLQKLLKQFLDNTSG